MNKLNFIFIALVAFVLTSSSLLLAQSDYETVQSFKNMTQQIQDSIKNASSLDDLDKLEYRIGQLHLNFLKNQDLLDKSLYPDDFESSIEKLRASLKLRKGDFSQINVLQTEVTQLQSQVDILNTRNTELMAQVNTLEEQSKTDKSKLAKLQKSIAELRASMNKRDQLVMAMLDSLMPAPYRGAQQLSAKEKSKIYSEVKKNNIIENIKKSISDNINFLKVTTLTPDDIDAIEKQQSQFESLWKGIGPKIIEAYAEKGKNVNHLKEIDSSFTNWHDALVQQTWNSVRDKFNQYHIILSRFSNGQEFTNTVTSFIDDERKNIKAKGQEASESSYKIFADSAWFGNVKQSWVPFLIDNKMFGEAQKDTIENHIALWKAEINPGGFNWLYLIIIGLLVVVAILFFVLRKPKGVKKEPENVNQES